MLSRTVWGEAQSPAVLLTDKVPGDDNATMLHGATHLSAWTGWMP